MPKSLTVPAVPTPSAASSVLSRSIALMKPVTWFPPMWAFLCGAVSSPGSDFSFESVSKIVLGMILAGPIVLGLSQIVNDYCDRDVDAINEPNRPIPSGAVTLKQIVITTGVLAVASAALSVALGYWVAILTAVGLILAIVYSAHPLRFKRNGWIGNGLVAFSYEGLPWIAGSLAFGQITQNSLVFALLFAAGAHGIMTINDFKSIHGDRIMGIKSIPVQVGTHYAAFLAVFTISLAQLFAVMLLGVQGMLLSAALVFVVLLAQTPIAYKFIREPEKYAVFYNSAVGLYVIGMLVAAVSSR